MKKNRLLNQISCMLFALIMMFGFFACGSAPAQEGSGDNNATAEADGYENLTIRYGNVYNETTNYGKALEKMRADIEQASGGNILVDIYHGGILGSEQEHAQAQKEGSIEMLFSGTAGVGLFVPATTIFEIWYAFESIDQLGEAVDMLWDDLDKAMQEEGFKLLGAYYDGPREILSNKKITDLAELKSVKLRAPGSQIYVNSISALGAQAVSIPLGDVYTALQSGGIDAMENTIDNIYQQKFYEQGKYLVRDAHVFMPLFITYNLDAWNVLPIKTQTLIIESVQASMDYQMQLYRETLKTELDEITASGVEQVEIVDRDKWIAAVQTASEAYAAEYGDFGKKIYEVVKSFQQ